MGIVVLPHTKKRTKRGNRGTKKKRQRGTEKKTRYDRHATAARALLWQARSDPDMSCVGFGLHLSILERVACMYQSASCRVNKQSTGQLLVLLVLILRNKMLAETGYIRFGIRGKNSGSDWISDWIYPIFRIWGVFYVLR